MNILQWSQTRVIEVLNQLSIDENTIQEIMQYVKYKNF